jgi:hypothetical protein
MADGEEPLSAASLTRMLRLNLSSSDLHWVGSFATGKWTFRMLGTVFCILVLLLGQRYANPSFFIHFILSTV